MRTRFVLVAGVILVAHVHAFATTKDSTLSKLVGSWTGRVEGEDQIPIPSLSVVDLVILKNGRFKMTESIVKEGNVRLSGSSITLITDHIGGRPLSDYTRKEFKNQTPPHFAVADIHLRGNVRPNLKQIMFRFSDRPTSTVVFRRSIATPPRAVGPSSVTATEAPLVGEYKGKIDVSKVHGDKALSRALGESAWLKLSQDNTFSGMFLFEGEGTWSRSGDEVMLLVTKLRVTSNPHSEIIYKFILKVGKGNRLQIVEGIGAPDQMFVKQ